MFSETRALKRRAGGIDLDLLARVSAERNAMRILAELAEASGEMPMAGLTRDEQAALTWRLAASKQHIGDCVRDLDGPDKHWAEVIRNCLAEDELNVLAEGGTDAQLDWDTIHSGTDCLPHTAEADTLRRELTS